MNNRVPMNVLVVDDDEITRRHILTLLGKFGLPGETANDGLEAIAFLKNKSVPVVITDWMMPNVDGLELIREIRSRPNKNYIYIIMLTAKGEKESLIQAMEAGADAFLSKPVDPDELNVSLMAARRVIDLEMKLSAKNAELANAYKTIRNDIAAAGAIQKSLLPEKVPVDGNITFDWLFKPYSELGGDIFNVFQIEPSLLGVYMIDVSGKGVEAALLAVTLSRMLTPFPEYIVPISRSISAHTQIDRILGPAEVATLLNARFYDHEPNHQFFTLLYGTMDTATATFRYTTAGHTGIIFSGSTTYALSEKSFPICFTDNPEYHERSIQLSNHDRLFFFTDGLYETTNSEGRQFGVERMVQVIDNLKSESLHIVLTALYEEARAWSAPNPISDDVSALALEAR